MEEELANIAKPKSKSRKKAELFKEKEGKEDDENDWDEENDQKPGLKCLKKLKKHVTEDILKNISTGQMKILENVSLQTSNMALSGKFDENLKDEEKETDEIPEFLKAENIQDKNGNHPISEDYDPTSLLITPS